MCQTRRRIRSSRRRYNSGIVDSMLVVGLPGSPRLLARVPSTSLRVTTPCLPRFPSTLPYGDLRRTRPPPPPTAEYIYQAWIAEHGSAPDGAEDRSLRFPEPQFPSIRPVVRELNNNVSDAAAVVTGAGGFVLRPVTTGAVWGFGGRAAGTRLGTGGTGVTR
jgi:hypothetical protein